MYSNCANLADVSKSASSSVSAGVGAGIGVFILTLVIFIAFARKRKLKKRIDFSGSDVIPMTENSLANALNGTIS